MRASLFCILVIVSKVSFAQFDVSVGSTYEIPIDEKKDIYKNFPAYQLTFFKSHKYKAKRKSWGFQLGYSSLKPKADTLYYLVETNNGNLNGYIHYIDYTSYQLMLSSRFDFLLSKGFELFYGVDAGLNITSFEYTSSDPYSTVSSQEIITRFAFSPRIGMSLNINSFLYLSVFGKYSISLGFAEDRKDQINQFTGIGGTLGLRFGAN